MTISLIDTQANGTDQQTSTVVPAPTVADGDMMIMAITIDDSAGITNGVAPVGWTLGEQRNSSQNHGSWWWKVASSESGSYTITHNAERTWASLTVLRGDSLQIASGDTLTGNVNTNLTTAVFSATTPSNDGSAVVAHVGCGRGNNSSNPIASGWPSSLIEQQDNTGGPGGTGTSSQSGALAVVIQTTAATVSGSVSLAGLTGTTDSIAWLIVVEEGVVSSTPSITDADDEDYRDGETGITITGTNFETPVGSGKVELSDNAVYASGTKVEQTDTSWSDTSIDFTAVLGALNPASVWLWVTNDTGETNAVGYPVAIHRADAFNVVNSGNGGYDTGNATTQLLDQTGAGTFSAGEVSDTTNQITSIAIIAGGNTELEWVVEATSGAINAAQYEFRLVASVDSFEASPLLPKWTIGDGIPPTFKVFWARHINTLYGG